MASAHSALGRGRRPALGPAAADRGTLRPRKGALSRSSIGGRGDPALHATHGPVFRTSDAPSRQLCASQRRPPPAAGVDPPEKLVAAIWKTRLRSELF